MPWLLNEDEAMKAALAGIKVSDDKNATRDVRVWFGQPDVEITAQTYPYMTIDLIDISMDAPRAIHGIDELPYIPEGFEPAMDGHSFITESPIPIALDYQVTTYTRHPRHDRTVVGAMHMKFPYQFGGIYVSQDNTQRRAFLTRFGNRDRTDENSKRLFSKVFTVRVESELILTRFLEVQQALAVTTDLTQIVINQDVSP